MTGISVHACTMSSADVLEEVLAELCQVTACDKDSARALLDQTGWDLLAAIDKFFEGGARRPAEAADTMDSDSVTPGGDPTPTPTPTPAPPPPPPPKKPTATATTAPRFATLQTLKNECQNDSSDEEEGQAFYAGGSERSGQQILGPGKNKKDVVAEMFESVRGRGAAVLNPDEPGSSNSNGFGGVGYRLGNTMEDSEVVGDESENETESRKKRSVTLQLWRNGFSLDDGELRPYSDPANEEFLAFIRRGEIPPELRKGPEVYLTMEDLRHEEFNKVARGPPRPFQGEGHILGSPTPPTVCSTAPVVCVDDREANMKVAQDRLALNEGDPITAIQIRLEDGSRLIGRFNHTHTVAQLREFVTTAAPVYQLREFSLQTTFPNRELTDLNQTIKDAGLINALVVQRLK